MKGFLALVMLALVGLSLANFWQIQQLQGQVASLQGRVQKAEEADLTTQALNKAMILLAQAQEAARRADYQKARELLGQSVERADQMRRVVGDKAGPAATWLREQTQHLEEQIRRK